MSAPAPHPDQPLPERLSGPLIDRTLAPHASAGVDIHTEIPGVPFQKLSDERHGEPSAAIRTLVEATPARQYARFANVKDGQGASLTTNADMGPAQVRDYCLVDETGRQLLGAGNATDEPRASGRITGCSSYADRRGPGGVGAHPAGTHQEAIGSRPRQQG